MFSQILFQMQNVVLGIKIYNNVKKEQHSQIIIGPFHAKTGNIDICLKYRPGSACAFRTG